ncbi:MAG: YfhO family protein [Clostridiales bacterium]|nr:YfhO family protein [Clostridiales bacterium]
MKEVASLASKSRPKKKTAVTDKSISLPVITFFVTLFLVFLAFTCYSKLPLGRCGFLISDLKDQFVPELLMYKHHIEELDFSSILSSFSYSTLAGCGRNYMSTFGYYLASPFNLIIFLFDDAHIATAISVISAIRLAFGSAFLCMFLQKRNSDHESNWPLIFSVMYAFSSFAISFLFCILWFDAYMLLPLLLYFIEKYIEEDKKIGIVFTLIFLFVSNFYASYMAGIFSFFYLVGRLIYIRTIEKKITSKTIVTKTAGFILLAVLCTLSAGAFLLPVGMDVINNRDTFVPLTQDNHFEIRGFEYLSQIFLSYNNNFDYLINNLPFLFISMAVTILVTIFFVSKIFTKKDKFFYGILIVLISISFNIPFVDKMWQAFDRPNWFQHRYSFVFMPVFICLAYRVFRKIKEINYKEIGLASGILLVLYGVSQFFSDLPKNTNCIFANTGLIVCYTLLFMAVVKKKWPKDFENFPKIISGILVAAVFIELIGISPRFAEGTSVYLHGAPDAEYRTAAVELNALNLYMETENNGVRVMMESDNRNSGELWIGSSFEVEAFLGQNGISQFDSSANRRFSRFIKQFGYRVNFNYATYDSTYTSLPTDAFLSVGNVVTTSEYNNGVLVSPDDGDHRFRSYRNDCVLPVGFAVDKQAADFDFYALETLSYNKDYFDFQNRWYKSMFPDEFKEDVYVGRYLVTDDDITVKNAVKLPDESIDYTFSKTNGFDDLIGNEPIDRQSEARNAYYRINKDEYAVFTIKHKVTQTGEQYISIVSSSLLSHFHLYLDEEKLMEISPSSFYSIIVRLGYYEEGEEINVTLASADKCFSYQDIYFAAVDEETFKTQFKELDLNKVVVDKYDNGNAVFTTNLDNDEMLLTTIPYENGWTCYIDGEEKEIQKYADILIAVDPGEGAHKVELKFLAPGIKEGMVVSAVGIFMLAAYICISSKKKNALVSQLHNQIHSK